MPAVVILEPDYGAELPLASEEEGMLDWQQTGLEAAVRAELSGRAELVVHLWPLRDD